MKYPSLWRLCKRLNGARIPLSLACVYLVVCPSDVASQQETQSGNPGYRSSLIARISSLLEAKYVLPDAASNYAAELRAREASGTYDSCPTPEVFAERVTADLHEITRDSHIRVRIRKLDEGTESIEGSLYHPMRFTRLREVEHSGYVKLDWIDGKIGYLALRRFYPISVAKEQIDGAMRFLSTADAIIIDLREHQGGDVESLEYLCSYFLEYPTQLTGFYFREDDFLTEHWTTEVIGGGRLLDVPLFLLTSGTTFSAAEMFAYDLSVRDRATLVGDTTMGGAHSVDLYRVDGQFEIYIPTARAISPVTSSNWEGSGVIPDVVVSSEVALDTATVLAAAAAEERALLREARYSLAAGRIQQQLDQAQTLYRDGHRSAAQIALDSAFQLVDSAGLLNEFFVEVLAYEYLADADEEILYAICKKRIELFPESSAAYAALGYVHFRNDEYWLAIECYEKVLELRPDNRNAEKMISRLRAN